MADSTYLSPGQGRAIPTPTHPPSQYSSKQDLTPCFAANKVREAVEALAFDLDVLVEFESDE